MNHPIDDGVCWAGWACDARTEPEKCLSGITDFRQTDGKVNYQCKSCDFDYCEKCETRARPKVRLTAWAALQHDGSSHLGLRCNAFHHHQMALITSGCASQHGLSSNTCPSPHVAVQRAL